MFVVSTDMTTSYVISGRYAGPDFWRFRGKVVIERFNKESGNLMISGIDGTLNGPISMFVPAEQVCDFTVATEPINVNSHFSFTDVETANEFIRDIARFVEHRQKLRNDIISLK